MRRSAFGAVATALLFITLAGGRAEAANGPDAVDVELVLAVDVSLSMDEPSYRLEMQGYADAFRNPAVQEAIQMGGTGRVAVALMQWSGYANNRLSVGWTKLDCAGDAENLAQMIEQAPRMPGGSTSISGAIDKAMTLFDGNGFDGARRVIDISGDGRNNNGRNPAGSRAAALAQGMVINGLPIASGEPGLEEYYRANVIGGPGAFLVVAKDFDDFGQAIAKKLIAEIAALAPDAVRHTDAQGVAGVSMLAFN